VFAATIFNYLALQLPPAFIVLLGLVSTIIIIIIIIIINYPPLSSCSSAWSALSSHFHEQITLVIPFPTSQNRKHNPNPHSENALITHALRLR
jgi:uncharacterized membrane protein